MKRLILILVFALFSCSTDDVQDEPQVNQTCYQIMSRGYDARGNYIIIRFEANVNKRYKVEDYRDYLGQQQICDLTNLIEQPL